MLEELLQELQQVVQLHRPKVSIVGNDMVDIMLRDMLEQEVVCSICLYSDHWHLGLI